MPNPAHNSTLRSVVLAGLALFVASAFYVSYRIYQAFEHTGIPVWSGGKVVATLAALPTTLVALVLCITFAGLIARRTWLARALASKDRK